jgi:hypothetical protein
MIFDHEPRNWSDLQNKVAQIFSEMGCIVEIEKDITTTRGLVNVDVFVEDITKSPKLIYICECKHWGSSIPKSVVHSFRTVITDYGAHVGYLISKKGYQSGAYEAAINSNVMLLTWNEFQEFFFDAWYAGMWKRVHSASTLILQFLNPGFFGEMSQLLDSNEEARSLYYAMFEKFCAYVEVSLYPRNLIEKTPLPLTIIDPRPGSDGKVEVTTYQEYFEILLSSVDFATESIKSFKALYRLSS